MTTTAPASDIQIELRPYQRDALTAIEAAALRGVRRQVVSLRVLPASQLDIPDVVRWTRLSGQTRIRLRRCQLKGCIPH